MSEKQTTTPWYENHDNIASLASWMADNDYTAKDVAYMVGKPWKFDEEFAKCFASQTA